MLIKDLIIAIKLAKNDILSCSMANLIQLKALRSDDPPFQAADSREVVLRVADEAGAECGEDGQRGEHRAALAGPPRHRPGVVLGQAG